jgi:hypothetical protein
MTLPNFAASPGQAPLRGLIAIGVAASLIGLCGCAKVKDGDNEQAVKTPPPSQTTGSAPGPSPDGVQHPPNGQTPNGAATVNNEVVQH